MSTLPEHYDITWSFHQNKFVSVKWSPTAMWLNKMPKGITFDWRMELIFKRNQLHPDAELIYPSICAN